MLGAESVALSPRFEETRRALLDWLPRSEGAILDGVTHGMRMENPGAIAGTLAGFLARHPIAGRA